MASISHLAYEVGRSVALADLPDLAADAKVRDRLTRMGYRDCSVFDGTIGDLVAAPLRKAFADPALAGRVDAVLVAQRVTPFSVAPFLLRAGVSNVPVIEIGGMNCANMASAIAIADAWVRAGVYRAVLCCFACKVADDETRIAGFGYSVIGDGAVCCLVSADRGDFTIAGIRQSTSLFLHERGEQTSQLPYYLPLCRNVFKQLVAGGTVPPSGFDHLVSANFPLAVELMTKMLGSASGRPYSQNLARLAHISSADLLINLKDLRDAGEQGDVLLSGIAPHSICMMHLRSSDCTST